MSRNLPFGKADLDIYSYFVYNYSTYERQKGLYRQNKLWPGKNEHHALSSLGDRSILWLGRKADKTLAVHNFLKFNNFILKHI